MSEHKLWCMHIPGPDDIYAAPDYETAKKMAEKHNAAMEQYIEKLPWCKNMVTAKVIEWPGDDAASHAESLREFDPKEWGMEGGAA